MYTLKPANNISFLGTKDIASYASSSLIYESYLQGSSTWRKRFQILGPSLPPFKHNRKSSLSLYGLPIPLSPNLSPKLTLSPFKKKVSEYLDSPSSSANSSAIDLILSFAGFFIIIDSFLSSLVITLTLTSISVNTSSYTISTSTSSY
jgi:hypothetical protein